MPDVGADARLSFLTLVFALRAAWVSLAAGMLAVYTVPRTRALVRYGKTTTAASSAHGTSYCWRWPTVKKTRFVDFYLLAVPYNAWMLASLIRHIASPATLNPLIDVLRRFIQPVSSEANALFTQTPTDAIVSLALMQVHGLHRLWDTAAVDRPSATRMPLVTHYLFGIAFYILACVSIWVEAIPSLCEGSVSWTSVVAGLSPAHAIGAAVALWAGYQQHLAHTTLANLRTGRNPSEYVIPRGGWFEWVASPHYFFEIVVYVALLVTSGYATTVAAMLLLVVTNLGITATEGLTWYRARFGADWPPHRRAIVPFLW